MEKRDRMDEGRMEIDVIDAADWRVAVFWAMENDNEKGAGWVAMMARNAVREDAA